MFEVNDFSTKFPPHEKLKTGTKFAHFSSLEVNGTCMAVRKKIYTIKYP
jgi:hypothetical protein